jgi:hypothetical protein
VQGQKMLLQPTKPRPERTKSPVIEIKQ